MALPNDNVSMALYCDFENVALGVRDAKYSKFDIKPVLERLLLKGSIVLKKAYCDWDRYKDFKPQMHEASFELIEIPHVRQSGKNSADIRLVVDALDLCYTKAHVNTFVIISGDSDFSPLVSKLRENAKYVIGVGVKNSTSDLLIANCDEFIFIDDLQREGRREAARKDSREPRQARTPASAPSAPASPSREEQPGKEEMEARKTKAVDIAAGTFEALLVERGDGGKIWASALKQAIKRRRPDFNESYFGFKTFGNLLEEAQSRGLLDIGRDDKSGAYVYRGSTVPEARSQPPKPAETNPVNRTEPPTDAAGEEGWAMEAPVSRQSGSRLDDADNAESAIVAATLAAFEIPEQATPRAENQDGDAGKEKRQTQQVARKKPASRGRQKKQAQIETNGTDMAQGSLPARSDTAQASAPEATAPELPPEGIAPAARKSTRGRRPRKTVAAAAGDE